MDGWTELTQGELGREGAKQNFVLALIVMMFASIFAFILPSLVAADSWTDTTTENFALGTHENTESVDDNVRLEDIGVGIYYTQGRFTSQAFDAGQVVEDWGNISWSVTTPSLTKQENDNVGAEPDSLIDTTSRVGTVAGGSPTDTRDNDGVYENIQENNLGTPITDPYYEAVTVVVSGDNLNSPDKLDADDGDNYRVSAGASVENTDYYMTLEPDPLVDGSSRIGVITGGSITDLQTQNNVYENIQENNIGALTTTQENAAVTVVVSGDNLSTPDKLNADDGDNYRVDAAYTPVAEDNLIENGDFTNDPSTSGWENTVTKITGNEIGEALWGSTDGFVSGHALGRSEDWSILWYQDFSATADPASATLKFAWRAPTIVEPEKAHIKVILRSPSAVDTVVWTKDYDETAVENSTWAQQENDVTSVFDESGTWTIFLQSDLFTGNDGGAEWRWDWDNVTLEVQTRGTYALEVQHDSATFSIPAGLTIENVRVRLNFGSDNTATYTLEIRDWQNSEWDILNTETVASGTEVTWDNTLTTDPDNYISSNDNIRVRLCTDAIENDHILEEDYLQFYASYTPSEYGLRWEYRITGLPTNGIAYYVRIYGYADTGENFGIYTWDGTIDQWVSGDGNLPSGAAAEGWVEYSISTSYLEGDNISIMYLSADNTDATSENIHIDYAGVRVTTTTYSIDVQHDSEPVSYSGTLDNIHVWLNVGSENTATYTLQIRDWQNSEWDDLETVAINNGTEYTFDNTLTVDLENYISATDNIRVQLITAAIENDHIAQEDYLVYEVNYTPTDYALRWEHRIENVATSYDNYWVRIRGYTSGDSENVGVYIWDNNASSWEFLDNLTTTEKTITKQIAGSSITQYLRGDNLSIKHEDYDNTDDDQTTVHIDLCIVQAENVYTTETKLQVATSADNIVWSDNLGPDGTTLTYFTTSPTSLGNIGDNRYFGYIAYLSTEDNTITPMLHDVTVNYTLAPAAPSAPTLYLPADGTYTNDNTPYFEWENGANAENHRLVVDNDPNFADGENAIDNTIIGDNSFTPTTELPPDNYYWKVCARNAQGDNWSENTWTFEVVVGAWNLIETRTGTVEAPAACQLIETWTGTIEAPAEWQLIESWAGTVNAPVAWHMIETWTSTVSTQVEWQVVESWTGTVSALAVWQIIESWTGTVSTPVLAEWKVIETWTGTVNAPAAWQLIETWTGTISAPAAWQLIETWTGTVQAPAAWQLIESWTGTVSAPAVWQIIESWTGTVSAPAEWQLIETWTGTVNAPAAWQLIETWTGTVEAPAAWQLVETWTGAVNTPAAWQVIETWAGTVGAPAVWSLIETWTETIQAPVAWQIIETWIGTVQSPVEWQLIETWTGIIEAPAEWQLIETWTRTIQAAAEWELIEAWTGVVEAPTEWKLIETWSGAIESPVEWQLIEEWLGTVSAQAVWDLIESWTGAVEAPVAWQLIETWAGTVEAPVEWQLIETWTGTVEAPAAWQLIETWTGVIEAPVYPKPTLYLPADGSITNDNTVYFEWSSIADAENYDLFVDNDSDFNSLEVSVTITDNYYTSSALLDENYLWRVRARDVTNNVSDNSATWTFLIDTIAPATPTLVSLVDNAVGSALAQTFMWTEPETGVTYDIQIDNETSFTSPYVHENTGLADNSCIHTFASDGVYYWRVCAVDAANNQSSWADNFKFTILAPPGQPPLYLPADGAITNDNTPTFEWTVDANADNHRLLVDNDPDFSSSEKNRIVLDNYYTIADENSLPDDNYSWKVIAINAQGENESSTWTFVIDTIAPSIPTPSLPADGASTDDNTIYFEWSSIADAEYYDLFVDNDPDFSSPEVSVTITDNYYTSSALLDGGYSWKVRTRDAANNVIDNSVARTFLIGTTPTPVSPGGAAVGSDLTTPTLGTVPPPSEGALTVTISTITAGGTGSADFTRYAIAVTEVRITTTSDVSGARVGVVMHAAKPAGVTAITLPVYSYFDLSTTVGTAYIRGATIKFKVSKSWVAQMNIDEHTIRLLRYNGGWQRLSTGMISSDSTYLYYETTTSGFLLFAIVGEPMVAPTPTSPAAPIVPTPTQSPLFFYTMLSMAVGVAGFVMAYRLLARPSRYYVMLKRLERAVIKPGVRSIGMPLPKPPARLLRRVSRAELAALGRLERIGLEKLLRERRS